MLMSSHSRTRPAPQRCPRLAEEVPHVNVKSTSDPQQMAESGVVLPQLDTLDRRPVDARLVGELFLGHVPPDAGIADT